MTEERITEVSSESPTGNTHTHTTVVRDAEPSSGGSKWVLILIVLVLGAGALFVFSQMGGAEAAKDNAVAGAAADVGNAANEVGEAAQGVGDAARDAADNLSE